MPARISMLFVFLLLTSSIVFEAKAADLLQVYRLAQTSDPTIESARYSYEAIKQKIPEATATLVPALNATGATNGTRADTRYTTDPDTLQRKVSAYNWALQLSIPVLRMQNVFGLLESESIVEQARAQYRQAEQDLLVRVIGAYFDIVVASETVGVSRTQVRAMAEQLAVAERGFEDGTISITDVDEARAHSDLALAQAEAADNDLDAKRTELEKIIGPLPVGLDALKANVVLPRPDPANMESWIAGARQNNTAVIGALAAVDIARKDIYKTKAERLPNIDLIASYGRNYSSDSLDNPLDFGTRAMTTEIGVQFNLPLYSGGGVSAAITEASAKMHKAQADLEIAKRQAAADARQAYTAIFSNALQMKSLESAVASSQDSVKGNQVGYSAGIRINSDVLSAEQQLYSAQRDLTKVRYDVLLQGVKLKAAAGILSEADLLAINNLLERPASP